MDKKDLTPAQLKELNKEFDKLGKFVSENYPPVAQFAIVTASSNIKSGCFWGFTNERMATRYEDDLKGQQDIAVRRLAGGEDYLVEVNPAYMTKAIRGAAPGLYTPNDMLTASNMKADAKADFVKFLLKQGRTAPGKELQIGLYCINDVTSIKHKGISYPAFRLSLAEALPVLEQLHYAIVVQRSGVSTATPVSVIKNNIAIAFESMSLSPTKTGVFLKIVPKGVNYVEIEKQYKASLRGNA